MPGPWAYCDTSVLAKRYVRENGTGRARALFRRYRFLFSAITPVELVSAVRRRHAEGDLTDERCVAILARIRQDHAHWELVELVATVLNEAEGLVERCGVKPLDAIHLALAVTFRGSTGIRPAFVTADDRQRQAAEREGSPWSG
jgi:predicted nucleic acid-binding protein